jgi:DNA-binding transcriptional LysR family regulator
MIPINGCERGIPESNALAQELPDVAAPRLVNRLPLEHWSLLSALGEISTLNQAATRINVTQPAATKTLADIEQAFGFALFERSARGTRATPLGSEVVAYARQTQSSLDRFLEGPESKRRGGHGHLVFGTIMGAAPDLVARAVADVRHERRRLNVRILGETSDPITVLLERHEIELAVGRFTDPLQHDKFAFAALAAEPLQAVVRRGHPLTRRRRTCAQCVSRGAANADPGHRRKRLSAQAAPTTMTNSQKATIRAPPFAAAAFVCRIRAIVCSYGDGPRSSNTWLIATGPPSSAGITAARSRPPAAECRARQAARLGALMPANAGERSSASMRSAVGRSASL